MERAKVFRGLRIAWTTVFGILCVLLVVLWVRSYWRADRIAIAVSSSRFVGVGSTQGLMTAYIGKIASGDFQNRLEIGSDTSAYRPQDSPQFRGVAGFGFIQFSQHLWLSAPHWFFMIVVGIVATLTWVWHRLSFSLRTLLIATTVIAVLLGLVMFVVR